MNVDKLRAGSDVCLYVGGTKSNPVRTAMVRHSPGQLARAVARHQHGSAGPWLGRAGQGMAGLETNNIAGQPTHRILGPGLSLKGNSWGLLELLRSISALRS